jgi:hypothetical protein
MGTATDATGASPWTEGREDSCATARAHVYCFGADRAVPLLRPCGQGRRAFVSSPSFDTGTGLAGADAVCQTDAAAAGLDGEYVALLAAPGAAAGGRLRWRGPTFIRADGVELVALPRDLGRGHLLVPLRLDAGGVPVAGVVATGTRSLLLPGGAAETCAGWTSADPARAALAGRATSAHGAWLGSFLASDSGAGSFLVPCGKDLRVYCFQR